MDAPIMEQIPVAVSPTNPSWRVRLVGWVIRESKGENRKNLICMYAFSPVDKYSYDKGWKTDDR